jgi:DNA-binding NarL/FixJ family response regulator
MRVLLVDDHEDSRDLMGIVFRRAGAEVVGEASNGVQGIAMARDLKPDLVVLDLEMPVMSGMEALPELRLAAPGARVVVVSNLPSEAHAPATAARGAVGYVEKSTSPLVMYDEIVLAAGLVGIAESAMAAASSRLPRDRRSAGAARRFVEDTLDSATATDVVETATLLVSEVVANAVVHAGSVLDLKIWVDTERLRVEVADGLPVPPMVKQGSADTTTGRGMFLIDSLADRWGTELHEGGKTVWFEVDRGRPTTR